MLVNWRSTQDELREALGHDYIDYDLVFAGYYGMPTEASSITDDFQRLIAENNLPIGSCFTACVIPVLHTS